MADQEMITVIYDDFGEKIAVTVPVDFARYVQEQLATWGECREELRASTGSGTINPDIAFRG